ncbi:MAG: peptide ABC transporter substrate-binding protein [Desulfobacteraceae bacterium]|nr:peptide ABC transporter substrate-binding protein [Desulfobacteraceae bacterium]
MKRRELKKKNCRVFKSLILSTLAICIGFMPICLINNALAADKSLTIAYIVDIPSWDAQNSVNPNPQSLWKCVFDQFLTQDPDLKIIPEVLSEYGYKDKKNLVFEAKIQEGIKFHNGDPLTAEDVKFSLDRMKDPEAKLPLQVVWAAMKEVKVTGKYSIRINLSRPFPSLVAWLPFLGSYVYPKNYFEKVGLQGFLKNPVGSGPYKVAEYIKGSHLKLTAFEDYWRGAPKIKKVTFKFVTEPTSRVAEIESGNSDLTLEVPFEEFVRLGKKTNLETVAQPVSDVVHFFINDVEPMNDENVRLALNLAIDREAIVKYVLQDMGIPLYGLQTPEYPAYQPDLKIPYDPITAQRLLAVSGYSKKNPVKFSVQTTNGYVAKDFEVVQAIVGMWKKVGIDAKIEVYDIAKHYELRAVDKLAPVAFYVWGNATGDPENSTWHTMFGPSPHSVWDGPNVTALLGPLAAEGDYEKRIELYKNAESYIINHGMVIPLYQRKQPIVFKKNIKLKPYANNWILPYYMDIGN